MQAHTARYICCLFIFTVAVLVLKGEIRLATETLKQIRNEVQELNISTDRIAKAHGDIAATFGEVEVYNERGGLVSQRKTLADHEIACTEFEVNKRSKPLQMCRQCQGVESGSKVKFTDCKVI